MSSFRNNLRDLHIAPFGGPPWYVAGAWLAVALLLQVTLMHYVRIRGVEPSLVLIAVVWYAIRVDSRRAAIYGLIAGLFEDVLATGTGGAWTISTTIAALTAGAISRGFFADSLPLVAMITVVVTLVRSLVFWVVWGFEGYPSGLAMLRFHEALLQALLNAILMAAVMLAARQFDKRFA